MNRLAPMATDARREIRVKGLSTPVSHYTDVVVAGNLVFVSGLVAFDEHGSIVGGSDATAQARQVLANLGKCLDAAGATPDDVCKVTVYLTDMNHRVAVNKARIEFFGESRPASTLVEVSALIDPKLLVEIEAIAVLPESTSK